MSLVTLTRVYQELGMTEGDDTSLDALITSYIASTSALLERLTGRKFGTQTVTELVSQEPGRMILQVRQSLPVTSIVSIVFDGEIIDPDEYEIDHGGIGWVRTLQGFWEPSSYGLRRIEPYYQGQRHLYAVTYSGGSVPADVESAIVDQVVMMFSRRGQDKGAVSLRTGDWSVAYSQGGMSYAPSFDAAVKSYKRVTIA